MEVDDIPSKKITVEICDKFNEVLFVKDHVCAESDFRGVCV